MVAGRYFVEVYEGVTVFGFVVVLYTVSRQVDTTVRVTRGKAKTPLQYICASSKYTGVARMARTASEPVQTSVFWEAIGEASENRMMLNSAAQRSD